MCKKLTLRGKIDEAKAFYMEHYGKLDWQWRDEGLPYAIMDYHSSVGSVLDFTADDEAVAKENGFSMEDVIELCERDPDTGVTIEMYREAQLKNQ